MRVMSSTFELLEFAMGCVEADAVSDWDATHVSGENDCADKRITSNELDVRRTFIGRCVGWVSSKDAAYHVGRCKWRRI